MNTCRGEGGNRKVRKCGKSQNLNKGNKKGGKKAQKERGREGWREEPCMFKWKMRGK